MAFCVEHTHTLPSTFSTKEGRVVKETRIAAGRSCSSVGLFSLGVLCMKTQRGAGREEWEGHALPRSCSPSKYLLIIEGRPGNGALT